MMHELGATDELQPGERLGAFRIVDRLGSGGSGVVYRAERVDFPQTVAIKVFAREFFNPGEDGAAESGALASLDHRNIVRVLSRNELVAEAPTPVANLADHAAGRAYLVMEFVAGEAIDAAADRALLPVRERLRLLHGVCDAVSHAHRRLLVHGDLKPANVLVADGEPKLLDFGSARAIRSGEESDGERGGYTYSWASPEQRAGERTTVGSDVWSLGLLGRWLLAGIAASADPAEPTSHLLEGLPAAEVAELARVRGTTRSGLLRALRGDGDAILRRALALRPEDRYPTVEALGADLEAWATARPIAARQTSRFERFTKWVRRHRVLAASSALLAVVLLGSAAGIAATAARAAYQRRMAERQLEELVRMTGTLGDELYSSVRPLPGSAAAQAALMQEAHGTLQSLVAVSGDDPRLRRELADQYSALARLELGAPAASPQGRAQAAADLDQALSLLPPRDSGRTQLMALRQGLR